MYILVFTDSAEPKVVAYVYDHAKEQFRYRGPLLGTGDLCFGSLVYLLSGAMSLDHLATMTEPSLSCLLCFLCMLAIPIYPFLKFEEFLIYLYSFKLPHTYDYTHIIINTGIVAHPRYFNMACDLQFALETDPLQVAIEDT